MILKQTQKNRKFDQWLKRIIELKLLFFFSKSKKKEKKFNTTRILLSKFSDLDSCNGRHLVKKKNVGKSKFDNYGIKAKLYVIDRLACMLQELC